MTGTARRLLALVVGVVALLFAVVILDRSSAQLDLTAESSLTLSSQTREVIGKISDPITVSVFVDRRESGRAEAAALLSRYRRLNPRISYRLLDPASAPGEVRRLGVDPVFGGIAAEQGDKIERAPTTAEQDITSALARLQRDIAATVCFSTGHGERQVTATVEEGLSILVRQLTDNGYKVNELNLLNEVIDGGCDTLVMADPTAPLGDKGAVVGRWLQGGGRLLVLADPDSSVDLNPLISPFAVQVQRGLILEGSDGDRLPGDPITPIISRFRSGFPFVRRLPPLILPTVQAVVVDESRAEEGVIVAGFAQTSRLAYLEKEPAKPVFDPAVDIAGPLFVGAASQIANNDGTTVVRTRVAVIGDVDLATNAAIGEVGNGRLLVQLIDWLSVDEDLVTVSTNVATIRPLALTDARLRYARVLTAGLVPMGFLIAGALVWAVRRPR